MGNRLSKAAYRLEGQPMFNVLAHVQEMERQGKNIIHFEIGDPDFSTPKNIVNATIAALKKGETHYTSSMGAMEFRKTICETTFKSRGFKPNIDQVIVTPGANIIIYYAIRILVNPGEEVIIPDPGFPTYNSALKFCGAVPIRVPLKEKNEFRMTPQDIEAKITKKTKMIIINSPQNPTGSVITPQELNEIADIAEKHNVFLYSDEIYARMLFDNNTSFASPALKDRCKKRTIIANGFSKAFAMTGWRLGVAIGPEDVIKKMGLLLQTTSSCVAPFIQKGAIEAIAGNQTEVKKMMRTYEERRDLIVDRLNSIPGIRCLKPGGAFYVFPNISETGFSSNDFADFALKKANVALLPGTNFGQFGEGYVRLCYAVSKNKIEEGVHRLKKALKEYKK